MRDYEMMIVFDPDLDEGQLQAQTERVTALVTSRGGTIQRVDPWGRRRLAYPIRRKRDGMYTLLRVQLAPNAAAEIEHSLRLMESVMRYLIVRADELGPATPPMAPSLVPATAGEPS